MERALPWDPEAQGSISISATALFYDLEKVTSPHCAAISLPLLSFIWSANALGQGLSLILCSYSGQCNRALISVEAPRCYHNANKHNPHKEVLMQGQIQSCGPFSSLL